MNEQEARFVLDELRGTLEERGLHWIFVGEEDDEAEPRSSLAELRTVLLELRAALVDLPKLSFELFRRLEADAIAFEHDRPNGEAVGDAATSRLERGSWDAGIELAERADPILRRFVELTRE